MDSINKNQPEDNFDNLNSGEAINKIKEIVKNAETCFFCTSNGRGLSEGKRPMSVQKVEDDGSLWFLSAKDSHKNEEITINPDVNLFFQGSKHSDFLSLSGKASISYDKQKIDELWNPLLKTWFTEGKNDPRISLIKVSPEEGYYWDTKHGNAVAGIKMMVGAVVGKTLDDSIEGKISV